MSNHWYSDTRLASDINLHPPGVAVLAVVACAKLKYEGQVVARSFAVQRFPVQDGTKTARTATTATTTTTNVY